MLKNLRSHRRALAYTVVIDHALTADQNTPEQIAEALRFLARKVHHDVTSLGHQPASLTAVRKKGVISARFVARVPDDESALEMHALIADAMCEHATVRFVLGESVGATHDHPLIPAG